MKELHDEFAAWVANGTRDELPRDLALHASGCDGCMSQTAAFDALERVDLGAALPPPIRVAPIRHVHGQLQLVRAAGGALVVVIVLGVGAMAGSTIFGSRIPLPTSAPAEAAGASPAEGVLGGVPAFTLSPTASRSIEPSPSPSPSAKPDATPAVVLVTPPPQPTGGGPPPVTTGQPAPPTPVPLLATPQPATTVPAAAPTAAPTASPSASPSTAPTQVPTPTPDPTPDPTPTPSCDPSDPECGASPSPGP